MSRQPLALAVGDVAAFARALRRGLDELGRLPGHVEMLNLLARAAGYKNFQQLRAEQEPPEVGGTASPVQAPVSSASPAETVDPKRLNRLARYFDDQARLVRWPGKHTQRVSCLWALWSRLPAGTAMTEAEISAWLGERHLFGDHALLRRELVDQGMVTRTPDGREYRRLEVNARPTRPWPSWSACAPGPRNSDEKREAGQPASPSSPGRRKRSGRHSGAGPSHLQNRTVPWSVPSGVAA